MLVLMGGVPIVCYGGGALAFSRFQLDDKEHARIRAALDARAAAENHPGSSSEVGS